MRALLAQFLIVLMFAGGALADGYDGPVTEQAVREYMMARLKASPAVTDVTARDDGGMTVTLENGGEVVSYLDNTLVGMSNADPDDRQVILDQLFTTVTAMNTSDSDVLTLESLRWTVYDDAYLQSAYAIARQGDDFDLSFEDFMQPREHIAGDIWAVMVRDLPTSVSTVSLSVLKDSDIDVAAAREMASGMTLRLGQSAQMHQDKRSGMFLIEVDGYYESALMVVPEIWQTIGDNGTRQIVAATPARGWLLLALDPDEAMLVKLRSFVEEMHAGEAHPITKMLFAWAGDRWTVLGEK